ncbi:LLM class flavin-dependent oxidoreductase [Nocardioides insulae]|uniref:LLM class flavin-dependent oxidoreductase n=1 Tax=Nocardioides insulae TaxID=394734 RepID=UPI000683D857|nr:LLM class flavin-dependent oxidoreductase [Nocardioides insulae]
MRFGAHLPLLDLDPAAARPLSHYLEAARAAGFDSVSANDHLLFRRPWLDGIVALASLAERSADLTLATTVALPVIRGPIALAKAAAALADLSGGRFVLGVGAGSSPEDHAAVGLRFEERWQRFDEAVVVLRALLAGGPAPVAPRFYELPEGFAPRPDRPVAVWIGSWGSAAGLRRVARLGDGWLASAYNTTPQRLAAGRAELRTALRAEGRSDDSVPVALATTWTYLTESRGTAQTMLAGLAAMLNRDPVALAEQVLVGPAGECAEKLARYAEAGVGTVYVWPVEDAVAQVRRFGAEVIPRLSGELAEPWGGVH